MHGPDHPNVAAAFSNMGAVYETQGKYVKALERYEKDLAICIKVLGTNHENVRPAEQVGGDGHA